MKVDATEIVSITMSDGVTVAAAIYRPTKPGRYPALFAASPYQFDNNNAPDVPIFLWHETGPIAWYVERGYAYVHLDVRALAARVENSASSTSASSAISTR